MLRIRTMFVPESIDPRQVQREEPMDASGSGELPEHPPIGSDLWKLWDPRFYEPST